MSQNPARRNLRTDLSSFLMPPKISAAISTPPAAIWDKCPVLSRNVPRFSAPKPCNTPIGLSTRFFPTYPPTHKPLRQKPNTALYQGQGTTKAPPPRKIVNGLFPTFRPISRGAGTHSAQTRGYQGQIGVKGERHFKCLSPDYIPSLHLLISVQFFLSEQHHGKFRLRS